MVFKKSNFIERSLIGVLSFFKASIFAQEYASLNKGFLQSIDPRIKVVSIAVFLISALFTKSIVVLFYLYLLCLFLVSVSCIPLGFFLLRTWIFIPLFSLFIAVPVLFNIFTPGEALFSIKFLKIDFIITRQGLVSASIFFIRNLTSVSFVILLSLTSRHTELLKVLRIFRIPQVFVITLSMCYRYIYLFMDIIENTYLAIKSRVGKRIHYKRGQKIVAWRISTLWQKSYQLNQEVYNAMLSRGYRGEPRVLNEFKASLKDWLWLSLVIIIFVLLLYLNYKFKV